MKKLSCVSLIPLNCDCKSHEDDINSKIKEKQAEGWELVGSPEFITTYAESHALLLTFQKADEELPEPPGNLDDQAILYGRHYGE